MKWAYISCIIDHNLARYVGWDTFYKTFEPAYDRMEEIIEEDNPLGIALFRFKRKEGVTELNWDNVDHADFNVIWCNAIYELLVEEDIMCSDDKGRVSFNYYKLTNMINFLMRKLNEVGGIPLTRLNAFEKVYNVTKKDIYDDSNNPINKITEGGNSRTEGYIRDDPFVPKAPNYKNVITIDPYNIERIIEKIEHGMNDRITETHYMLDKVVLETEKGCYYYVTEANDGWDYRLAYSPEL